LEKAPARSQRKYCYVRVWEAIFQPPRGGGCRIRTYFGGKPSDHM